MRLRWKMSVFPPKSGVRFNKWLNCSLSCVTRSVNDNDFDLRASDFRDYWISPRQTSRKNAFLKGSLRVGGDHRFILNMLSFDEGSLSGSTSIFKILQKSPLRKPRRDYNLVADGGPLAYSFLNEAPFFGNFSIYRPFFSWLFSLDGKDSIICFLDLRLYPKSL